MKRFPKYIAATALLSLALSLTSCLGDDPNDKYYKWKEENDEWIESESMRKNPDGTMYYERISAGWNPSGYVLMHWHNDRNLTNKELSPISTSTVDVKYRLTNIKGEAVDSSYLRVTPADSIYRAKVNASVAGWVMGLTQMHIGDSVTLIVPYRDGYGATTRQNLQPYSNLIFELKLVGIPGYEINVN